MDTASKNSPKRIDRLILSAIFAITAASSVQAAVSIVGVEDNDGTFYYAVSNNQPSTAEAKQLGLDRCKDYASSFGIKNKCRELFASLGPGYFAIVENAPGAAARLGIHSAQSRQAAIEGAYARCNQNGRYECKTNASVIAWDGGPSGQSEPQIPLAPAPTNRFTGLDIYKK